ncbi:hypothetical protein [Streptomyces sp. NPDC058985]|uniref:hypothetical protein n=1 Tax=Streptomyces sp. NPDC058985 TaxID=3346684 RepID=UPI0036C59DAC
MTQIVGIRDGHRVITSITGKAGSMAVDRKHHPDCPCHAPSTAETQWPVFVLQRWDWSTNAWETVATYTSERGQGNAEFAVSSERASSTGPIRLLKDNVSVLEDNPATYYEDLV